MAPFFKRAAVAAMSLVLANFSWADVPLHPRALPQRQNPLMSSGRLLSEVVTVLTVDSIAALGGAQTPRYVSLGLDRDEYIYSIADQHFIRVVQKAFELPSWRLCGDWAQVRIEVFDENMDAIGSPEVWVFAFRDEQWQRLSMEEGGLFRKSNLEQVQLPPYAVRCFNLDHKELTDSVQ